MPDITADIEFLANLPKYQEEKPYAILLAEGESLDDDIPETNLEFEIVAQIDVQDMRENPLLAFDQCGFEYVNYHQSQVTNFETDEDIARYQLETRDLLTCRFDALEVVTWEIKLRRNSEFDRQTYDINDSLAVEGPAKGAHVDVTARSAREIVKKHLSPDQQKAYLHPGHRLRIINTWRPLNTVLEDRPLALCDSRTVAPGDLAAADRVLPDRVGEIYYVHHAPQQRWYWLEKQKTTEPFIVLMYDSMVSEYSARCMSPFLDMTSHVRMSHFITSEHLMAQSDGHLWKQGPSSLVVHIRCSEKSHIVVINPEQT